MGQNLISIFLIECCVVFTAWSFVERSFPADFYGSTELQSKILVAVVGEGRGVPHFRTSWHLTPSHERNGCHQVEVRCPPFASGRYEQLPSAQNAPYDTEYLNKSVFNSGLKGLLVACGSNRPSFWSLRASLYCPRRLGATMDAVVINLTSR